MSVSGSIRALSLDGIGFDVVNDADLAKKISKFEKEAIVNSGPEATIKYTKRNLNVSGVKLSVDATRSEQLRELDERLTGFAINYTLANGDIWRCPKATIKTENHTSMENVAEIEILPQASWQLFRA